MSEKSLNKLTEEIKNITAMINNKIIPITQKISDRSDFALNNKETIINRDEILKEIYNISRETIASR